jgi:hypothetical protein
MDKVVRFKSFLESLRTDANTAMIDCIMEGFSAIHEAGYVELDEARVNPGIARGNKPDQTQGITYRNPGQEAIGVFERLHGYIGDLGDRIMDALLTDVIVALKAKDVEKAKRIVSSIDARFKDTSSPGFGSRPWIAAQDMFNRIRPYYG